LNRFLPDTWWEALLRPFAMAAPDGNTYVEIMAPDWRFVFAILLAVLLAITWRKRTAASVRGVLVLLAFVALSFVPWLASSGNGRYFVPMLLLAGPLGVALAYVQPWSRTARALCALGMLALQCAATYDTRPWNAWSLASWREAPYFDIAVPADVRDQPATFVTITSISYSLLYPQFHPASHWMNISAMPEDAVQSPETRRARSILAESKQIFVLVPSVPAHTGKDGLPSPELQHVLDLHLGHQHLATDRSKACRLLESNMMRRMMFGDKETVSERAAHPHVGFWLCPLRYPVEPPPSAPLDPRATAVFDKLEQSCPGIFPPGTAGTGTVEGGSVRDYAGADMKLYVLDEGVYYKYWRAINPVRLGTPAEVLSPSFRMDCNDIRGRSGLPWQRSI
jgi:hypothetical protein